MCYITLFLANSFPHVMVFRIKLASSKIDQKLNKKGPRLDLTKSWIDQNLTKTGLKLVDRPQKSKLTTLCSHLSIRTCCMKKIGTILLRLLYFLLGVRSERRERASKLFTCKERLRAKVLYFSVVNEDKCNPFQIVKGTRQSERISIKELLHRSCYTLSYIS